jgi:ABC-2 type transport system permease protein
LLPWVFFQNSVLTSISSLVGNGNLIKKTYFPRSLLPAASVGSGLVSHFIEMSILLVALLAFGNYRALFYTPIVLGLIAALCLFSLGFGLLCSVLNVYYRDIEYLMGIVFLVWMYMTPIVYPESFVPKRVLFFLRLNPMTDFVDSFRRAWYDGRLPLRGPVLYAVAASLIVFVLGLLTFNRLEGRLAEEL